MAGISSPTTVLVVTGDRWLVAAENEAGDVSVDKCSFTDTLFFELTSSLLWGRLKIHYASVGSAYAATVQFNTLGEGLYREAVRCMLDGVNPVSAPAVQGELDPTALVNAWPLPFRNEVERYPFGGQRLLAAVQWPAILPERELVLMSEDTGSKAAAPRFGGTITYFPLARLADFHVSHQDRFNLLALEVNAKHGGEKLEIIFPSGHKESVRRAMEQAYAASR